jgi:indolepyruvate ferredoxin oxidoreductase
MDLENISLNDKYLQNDGLVYLTGSQALIRLGLLQARRDKAASLDTRGFICGYRGSPLHTLDLELSKMPKVLDQHGVKFLPAVNEDLAVTAVKGSQMAGAYGDGLHDGVWGIWYGKNPGLDRSIDAMRHANLAGSSKHGGVLAVCGDDHGGRSTDTLAHCEPTFEDMHMPVLYPANLQEVIDFGLLGIAMSRFCGAWVGFKITTENCECSGVVDADINRVKIVEPKFDFPPGGVHSRKLDWWFQGWGQRLTRVKLPAAVAFARANNINKVTHTSDKRRYGIVAAGMAWLTVLEAFRSVGISEQDLEELGISIYKVGMVFPHDLEGYRDFASGLDEVLVVEEKRQQIEDALREACYDLPEESRPRIVGRYDEKGELLVDDTGEMSPEIVVRAFAKRLGNIVDGALIGNRLDELDRQGTMMANLPAMTVARMPFFCSGCPHNRSTKAPEGARAHGGIGCHGMAGFMDRGVMDFCQMGGEGIPWVGESSFVSTDHIFQSLGEGTYFHSGSLAIRQAVAAGVNITYKILFNDAVAMTGGQVVDGPISVPIITQQVRAEGVEKILVVTDEPEKYKGVSDLAPGVTIHHRMDFPALQDQAKGWPGVSVLIYDQTCATEKRRRRKRGTYPDPAKRVFINDRVCEGCGDCGEKSNCLSVLPTTTDFGRKRVIDQSSCNKDYSCAEGFCPSFVNVIGGKVRRGQGTGETPAEFATLPEPILAEIPAGNTYNVLITGVGGTGVVTVGALLGMAARIDGVATSILDQMGLAQKGGSVVSHLRFANAPGDLKAIRINSCSTDLLLGCDSLTAAGDPAINTVSNGRTYAVINSNQAITGEFLRNPDLEFPAEALQTRITSAIGSERSEFVDANRLATPLMGDSIASNMFLFGYAWQKGLLPVSFDSIMKAIELNGVRADWNKEAFMWGRLAAHDLPLVKTHAEPAAAVNVVEAETGSVEFFANELEAYQNKAYADSYRALIEEFKTAAEAKLDNADTLVQAATRYAYKLMAYKDEYEVARLHADPEFRRKLEEQFEGTYKLEFNLAPPGIARKDKFSGEARKIQFGPWMMTAFRMLRHLKFLRGTLFDPFGKTAERKRERSLIVEYRKLLDELVASVSADNYDLAVEIASLPEKIKGYGHVKERHLAEFDATRTQLLAKIHGRGIESLAVEVKVPVDTNE